jgi:acyl-CoA reductase-like NAD-dependent aldehyde dehydrogenase
LAHEVFAPEEVQVLEGGAEAAAALLKLKFDHIFFTGSRRVGQLVLKAAAETLTPVTLELGGKCPCIVDADTNLRLAVKRIVAGKFFNAGQTCVAPDYVCVDERIHADFVRFARETIRAFFPPGSPSPDLARIVNTAHFDRLAELVQGTSHAVGAFDREKLYFPPTLLDHVAWSHPVMREEIFGPILPVLPYSNVDAALREISARPAPLALYLFSQNRSFVDRAVRATRSGGICVNDTIMQITNLNLPFGGIGESGFGRYHGRYGFETFSHDRSVMVRSPSFDLFSLRPPYRPTWRRIRALIR